ncbi:MAG: hypothetical protein ACXV9P_13420 [Acidimicrobiia bacterium]
MTAWRLEFASPDGTHGSVELEIPDGGGRARYEVHLSGPELGDGVIVVRDADVAPPKGRLLEIRADSLWAELVCETPGEHWGFGLEAFGLRFADEAEAATSDVGDRIAVGLDLEWEVPNLVHGELLVERARIPFDGTGTFVETASE